MNKRLSMHVGLFCGILVLIYLAAFFTAKRIYKCKPVPTDTHYYDSLVNERNRRIDSAEQVISGLELSKLKHDSTVKALKKENEIISNETNQQNEKIHNASDSQQRVILCGLLSDMRQYVKGH